MPMAKILFCDAVDRIAEVLLDLYGERDLASYRRQAAHLLRTAEFQDAEFAARVTTASAPTVKQVELLQRLKREGKLREIPDELTKEEAGALISSILDNGTAR
jgi:hypothetical protein